MRNPKLDRLPDVFLDEIDRALAIGYPYVGCTLIRTPDTERRFFRTFAFFRGFGSSGLACQLLLEHLGFAHFAISLQIIADSGQRYRRRRRHRSRSLVLKLLLWFDFFRIFRLRGDDGWRNDRFRIRGGFLKFTKLSGPGFRSQLLRDRFFFEPDCPIALFPADPSTESFRE